MRKIEVPDFIATELRYVVLGNLRNMKIECQYCQAKMFYHGTVGEAVDEIEYKTAKFGCGECGNIAYLTIGDSLDGQRYERFIEDHEEG